MNVTPFISIPRATVARAAVLGVGAVTALGRDLETISAGLARPYEEDGATGPLRVSDDLLAYLGDPVITRKLRRTDRFIRMAVTAASGAWGQGKDAAGLEMTRVGLIVSSGFGPHGRGFKFLDGILDCGDSAALPTDFSHSVHGAASAYISELLEIRGPSISLTDFEVGFESAVVLAQCWLSQGMCDRVLVGAVEELGDVMVHCAGRLLESQEGFRAGEGAVFLMLGRESGAQGEITIDGTGLGGSRQKVDLLVVESPRLEVRGQETPSVEPGQVATFSPYFGNSSSSAAMACLGGILSLKAGTALGKKLGTKDVGGGVAMASVVDSVATFMSSSDRGASTLFLAIGR